MVKEISLLVGGGIAGFTPFPIVLALCIMLRLRNQRTNGDYPDYNIDKIGQNTEKGPGDLRRFAVTRSAMENHQLTLV